MSTTATIVEKIAPETPPESPKTPNLPFIGKLKASAPEFRPIQSVNPTSAVGLNHHQFHQNMNAYYFNAGPTFSGLQQPSGDNSNGPYPYNTYSPYNIYNPYNPGSYPYPDSRSYSINSWRGCYYYYYPPPTPLKPTNLFPHAFSPSIPFAPSNNAYVDYSYQPVPIPISMPTGHTTRFTHQFEQVNGVHSGILHNRHRYGCGPGVVDEFLAPAASSSILPKKSNKNRRRRKNKGVKNGDQQQEQQDQDDAEGVQQDAEGTQGDAEGEQEDADGEKQSVEGENEKMTVEPMD